MQAPSPKTCSSRCASPSRNGRSSQGKNTNALSKGFQALAGSLGRSGRAAPHTLATQHWHSPCSVGAQDKRKRHYLFVAAADTVIDLKGALPTRCTVPCPLHCVYSRQVTPLASEAMGGAARRGQSSPWASLLLLALASFAHVASGGQALVPHWEHLHSGCHVSEADILGVRLHMTPNALGTSLGTECQCCTGWLTYRMVRVGVGVTAADNWDTATAFQPDQQVPACKRGAASTLLAGQAQRADLSSRVCPDERERSDSARAATPFTSHLFSRVCPDERERSDSA